MKTIRTIAALALLLVASAAHAASLPLFKGPLDPSNLLSYFNQLVQSVNQNASGYQPHNFLYNAAFDVQQRGTGIVTCGGTSGPTVTAYGPDRWACDVNVGSQQGRMQIVTSASGVTFAPAFPTMVSLYRNSAALTQPVVLEQFIKSAELVHLQGRPVIPSCWIANNTGAPTGVTATITIITGTGTDEGLGSLRSAVGMTASPAITPALTGLAAAGSYTTPALTTTATRYSGVPISVPATATEGAFLVSFTPGAESAGTTDGILVTGCQLEEAEPAQTAAGRVERVAYAQELARDQHFYAQWADNLANTFTLPGTCTETTSGTTAACTLLLPQTQDLAAPVAAVATATSFGMTKVADGTAEASTTTAVVASSNNPNSIKLTMAASETAAVGTMHLMLYANTGAANTISVNSDF